MFDLACFPVVPLILFSRINNERKRCQLMTFQGLDSMEMEQKSNALSKKQLQAS